MKKNSQIIYLNKFRNYKKIKSMIFIILAFAAVVGFVMWNYLVENPPISDLKIPVSENHTYNLDNSSTITPADIINEIDNNKNKPTLIYLYTTWCSVCKAQFPIVNELARKFQNTDLKIVAVAIDRNINNQAMANYLSVYGNIYFKPHYLLYQDGLEDLLKTKGIKFNKIIPLTVLINRNGAVAVSFTGQKGENYLTRKIMKSLSN